MKAVGGKMRLDLAQYRELASFAQFGSDLDKATRDQLTRGERLMEILKQPQYQPQPLANQVMILFAATNGFLDDLPVEDCRRFESEMHQYLGEKYHDCYHEIETKKVLTPELEQKMKQGIAEFKQQFTKKVV